MSVWNIAGSGLWGDAAKWTGGIPDAFGAVAVIDVSASSSSGIALISLEDGSDRTVGRLDLTASSTLGLIIQSVPGATVTTLRFAATGGTQAVINVDSNGQPNGISIAAVGGMNVVLESDTLVNTINSDTTFKINAPISGGSQLIKQGSGTLVLIGSNSFTGGLDIGAGTVQIASDANLGNGGPVILHGGTLLVTGPTTIDTDLLAYGKGGFSHIDAANGQLITLAGSTFTTLTSTFFDLGSSLHNGTIVLSVLASHIGADTLLTMRSGTVTFANAFNASNFFHAPGNVLVQLNFDATLDTAGFATRISNLDFDGGTLRSTSGTLNVSVDYTNAQIDNGGTVIGTAGADRLTFFASTAQTLNFSATVFSGWSDADDRIIFSGSADVDNFIGTTQADGIFGNAGDDSLSGRGGNDFLNGQAGTDSASGGDGNDVYIVDSSADTVTEAPDQGDDLVRASADFVLSDNVERLSLVGAARSGTGNGLNNTIIGSNGNDTLLSGLDGSDTIDGRLSSDIILGGNGEDFLIGGAGKDTLTGGADRDRFVFHDGDMKTTHALADIITDFDQGLDERIGLTGVDANEALGGVQTFKFIGTSAFSGTAGELRFVQEAGNTFIEGNTDTDLVADFVIRLDGLYTLDVTDFFGVTL